MTTTPKDYLAQVRGQYEVLPYPMRDFTKERELLYTSDHGSLDSISHEGWGGKRDMRKGIRVLIAGQGTGDATIFLAEQLRGTDAEIVSIDLSTASIDICKKRLAQRGLDNVKVLHMSILDLPDAGLGKFDFIDTSGVLHHLEDPLDGLKALEAVLTDDGIIGIMVYAFYGRLSVYLLQVLMQYLLDPEMDPRIKIHVANTFLKDLPASHPMQYAKNQFRLDLEESTGSGVFDLLLHSTDRAYTVPQLYEWMQGAGLYMGSFCNEWEGNMAYVPEVYTRSALLRSLLETKPEPERQAIGELMNGAIIKHVFYASKKPKVPAQIADDMVVTFGFRQRIFSDFTATLVKALEPLRIGEQFEQPVDIIKAPSLVITKGAHTTALLNLLGAEKPIGEIIAQVVSETGGIEGAVRADFERLFNELHSRRRVFLRHQSIEPYAYWHEIFSRIQSIPPITTAA